MRIEQFQPNGKKPIGEGNERKVYVDPHHEGKVIAETRLEVKQETPLQLKGKYYLTKIVHNLFPKNIPDIYQVGESKESDGSIQTIDRERITQSAEHEKLKLALQDGNEGAIDEATKLVVADIGAEMSEIDMRLSEIGLGFNIDTTIENYTRDDQGNVRYLESFTPWQVDIVNPNELEILFEEDSLREAINQLPDEKLRNECLRHLDRLLGLLEEERTQLREQKEPERPDCRERVEAFETKYAPYFSEEMFTHLNNITTVSEALADIKRKSVKIILGEVLTELQSLKSETNISDEEFERLFAKRNALMRAFGTLRNGAIDRSEPK